MVHAVYLSEADSTWQVYSILTRFTRVFLSKPFSLSPEFHANAYAEIIHNT